MSTSKFVGLTILITLAQFLSTFLAPIAVLFADKEGRLPKIFRWMETHDDLGWGAGTYESSIKWIYDKLGKRCALIWWLWRNRVYTLRSDYRVPVGLTEDQFAEDAWSKGRFIARKFGFSYWEGEYRDWWEVQGSLGLYWFRLYFRAGWKLMPYYMGDFPKENTSATGIIIPISLRISGEFGTDPVYWYRGHRK